MAYEIPGEKLSLEAAADLSALQYTFVKVDNTGKAAACGDGENGIGVLQNKPTAGQTAEIQTSGVSKIVQSATLTIGAFVSSSAAGEAQADAANKYRMGVLLENGGADNAIGTLLIQKSGKEA